MADNEIIKDDEKTDDETAIATVDSEFEVETEQLEDHLNPLAGISLCSSSSSSCSSCSSSS